MQAGSLARLDDPAPHARLLSNGRYTVLVTGAGSGASTCNGYALTSWGADRTEDGDGFFVYLRDLDRRRLWSVGHQPVGKPAERYDAGYEAGRVRFERLDDGIETRLDVCVCADDDLEIRRLRLRNRSDRPRRIEMTSYAEIVLLERAAHMAHPAFAKLFVQTEYVADQGVLLARRRPRSQTEHHPWMVHALAGTGALEHETDRARFVGRGGTLAEPRALTSTSPLSGSVGSVLDPVFSLRRVICLAPGEAAEVTLLLGVAPSREAALELAARCGELRPAAPGVTPALAARGATPELAVRGATPGALDAVFEGAAEHERACLRRLGISEPRAEYLQELAGAMLYGHPALRASREIIERAGGSEMTGRAGGSATSGRAGGSTDVLRDYGAGGEGLLPAGRRLLVVAHVESPAERAVVADLLEARAYWQAKTLRVDLFFLCGGPESLGDDIRRMLGEIEGDREAAARGGSDAGRVIVQRRAEIPAAQLDVIQACAHLVVSGSLPALGDAKVQGVGSGDRSRVAGSAEAPSGSAGLAETPSGAADPLLSWNGCGGFRPDGCEYVVRLEPDGSGLPRRPPMPWVNVVANEAFGFLVSESGAGYTWSRNSRENRLTPWYNDPVRDPHGEAFYVRDDDAGVFWSPLPGPAPPRASFEVRHGWGYTSWRHRSHELDHEVCTFVPQRPPDPVRITRLRLTNLSDRPRRLSLVAYHRLVLGVLPGESTRFVTTELDPASRAILARNRLNGEFSEGVVFAAALTPEGAGPVRFTGDRTAFLGRNGSPAAPAALREARTFDGATGAALDPCVALHVTVEIAPHGTVECAVLLGEAADTASVRELLERYRRPGALESALQGARAFWSELLSAVRVETPSPAVDLMVNGWLAYQALSCRLWGRSAFYQSGGAFGFRDQLQDAAAFAVTRPSLTRAQIVLDAAHQFVEGDVLHWWHPPMSRGIRTRFSDDLLWLPYVTAFYVHTTGDRSVLDESVGFVAARPLAPGEDEAYVVPAPSVEAADVYTHCCRALDRSLTCGAHGLPLMGTGDWNDGMNRVGREGRGESVWLGFFLYRVLADFLPICDRRADHARAQRYRAYQTRLRVALDEAGWDGAWYRRAYYDDGTPLGSAASAECRIDALAQAWAVLSKAAPRERAAQAMDAVAQLLVSPEGRLIRLLAPPFDRDPHDPGYIKGYVPGIRENGGQYTHAALWVVQALAELGRRDRAAALLEMLSPVSHAATPEQVGVYQVEPYVIAADVYGVAPHVGRGGWTWYTGSAAWMYRVALESVLGVRLVGGDTLVVRPCIPDAWPGFSVRLRLPDGATVYEIAVHTRLGRAAVVTAVIVDGQPGAVENEAARIPLVRDGARHRVDVTLGSPMMPRSGSMPSAGSSWP